MKLFEQLSTKINPPEESGWYNTDKGMLYYYSVIGDEWSCRDDRLSEEYPSVWYKKVENN